MDTNNNINGQEEELNLRDIFYTILRNKWMIIISFFTIVILTVVYTLRAPNIYKSSSLLLIEDQSQSFINPFSSMGNSQFEVPCTKVCSYQ